METCSEIQRKIGILENRSNGDMFGNTVEICIMERCVEILKENMYNGDAWKCERKNKYNGDMFGNTKRKSV